MSISSPKGMLARLRKLEAARTRTSSIQRWFGSVESFKAEMLARADAGVLDKRDLAVVLACIERWHSEAVWAAWGG